MDEKIIFQSMELFVLIILIIGLYKIYFYIDKECRIAIIKQNRIDAIIFQLEQPQKEKKPKMNGDK